MKQFRIPLFCGPLLSLLLTCCLAMAADNPELQKLRYSVLSSTAEQVVLQFNGSYSPKVFTLKGEMPRVVFDFPEAVHGREIKNITNTDGAIVKRIRVGMHTAEPRKTRVVFDVATLNNLTYTQQLDEKSSTLTVRFSRRGKMETAPPKTITEASKRSTEPLAAKKTPPVSTVAANEQETTLEPAVSLAQTATKSAVAEPAQPEAGAAPKPLSIPQAAPTDTAVAPKLPANVTAPQPTETVKTEDEKKVPPIAQPQPQPEATADTKKEVAPPAEATKPAASPVTEPEPLLEAVTFDGKSPKGEMVLFKLNGFYPPDVHGIQEGIPRVFCDFKNTRLQVGNEELIKTNGKYVKLIRLAKYEKSDKIQVVLDLEPKRSYDLQQVFFKEDNLFVIIVNTVKN